MTMRKAAVRALDEKNFHPYDPLVAVLHRRGGELLGVRAGLGLGHRITGEDLAVEEGQEAFLLLLLGPVVGDDLGVAGVGRLGPEHDRGPLGHPEDLAEQGQLDLAVPLAAQLRAQVGGPQVVIPHLLLHVIGPSAVQMYIPPLTPIT